MILSNIMAAVAASTILSASQAFAHSPPDTARVFFTNLQQGVEVTSPFRIAFGIQGFGVTSAGDSARSKHVAGHFHLLVNQAQLPDMEQPLPYTRNIIHFDRGETETTLELPAGRHTLQLMLADEEHEPHDPPLLSEQITITVNR
jgi:hypothetical protein